MKKTLVAYFSASGVTKKVAQALSVAANADTYEIKPTIPYSKADLNWMNKQSRSSLEMKDLNCRPEIANKVDNMSNYDVIFLGFPIWWYREPSIIDTFLESYDFNNKKIILFATSGGSGFGKTVEGLKKIIPNANISEGKLLNGTIKETELKSWIESLNL